ncbi:unnamed protein product [Clonostachys rosea]|uniref:Chromo domain-containing protein n=1 Tax=Bionectria ochroleuca TaxID=29856 RepID=A0ABY6UJH8_BIOOC|nr:unnamed protein product [Clonostachys rosea]
MTHFTGDSSDNAAARRKAPDWPKICDYRWAADDSLELQVLWPIVDKTTWLGESIMHRRFKELLLDFWRDVGGRPENPFDPEVYQVFAVRGHARDKLSRRKMLQIEWTGYETLTWEDHRTIRRDVPDLVDEYFQQLDEASSSSSSSSGASASAAKWPILK